MRSHQGTTSSTACLLKTSLLSTALPKSPAYITCVEPADKEEENGYRARSHRRVERSCPYI